MNTEDSEKRVDPGWVQSLLDACKNKDRLQHSSDCNQSTKFFPSFCVTCLQLHCKFCPKGANHPHEHHLVLPVYKASPENCLQASQVSKLIDISDIHPFIINHKQVVFVNRRHCEQSKSRSNKSSYTCKTCGREFQREKRFCSVQCKSDSGESLELKQNPQGEAPHVKPQSQSQSGSYRKRTRKGMPSRFPFLYISQY
ncbi:uncharacterized protein At3g50808-like [Prosopis cineraria]|uniref:uncharacterized protein At3g50808-like n=1 Tax=Prosopis cineraria TaxID=364024 RepID=UPI00240F270F|nr:uncharacterized protein At3g50808-like [Prosopis cineraria]